MKTTILKYITVTFAAGAMLLAGCNDLDQEPTNKFTDKAFWTSPERANMVLNMAYNQMFGHDKIWQDEALSDNLYEQRGNAGRAASTWHPCRFDFVCRYRRRAAAHLLLH